MTKEQRGEETVTYCVGDTLWLMLVLQLVLMLVSVMLQIHRDVGVAVRQAEVEGGNAVPVGVDGDHKLSLFITNGPTKFHFTAPFHFDHLNPFTALHFHSTHSRCITTSKQIFHINREKS